MYRVRERWEGVSFTIDGVESVKRHVYRWHNCVPGLVGGEGELNSANVWQMCLYR